MIIDQEADRILEAIHSLKKKDSFHVNQGIISIVFVGIIIGGIFLKNRK